MNSSVFTKPTSTLTLDDIWELIYLVRLQAEKEHVSQLLMSQIDKCVDLIQCFAAYLMTDSSNSSMPPSQDPFRKKEKKSVTKSSEESTDSKEPTDPKESTDYK